MIKWRAKKHQLNILNDQKPFEVVIILVLLDALLRLTFDSVHYVVILEILKWNLN